MSPETHPIRKEPPQVQKKVDYSKKAFQGFYEIYGPLRERVVSLKPFLESLIPTGEQVRGETTTKINQMS